MEGGPLGGCLSPTSLPGPLGRKAGLWKSSEIAA